MVGDARGTPWYVAPEQVMGELVDARADLYALGCMLYEILTGRPPFTGDSTTSILWQHLEQAPLPPSQRVEGLDPAWDELCLRLLAKRPSDRIGHADDVAAALIELGAEGGSFGPPSRTYLYRPALAGREELLLNLDGQLRELTKKQGGLTLLTGESGSGKTRLAMEMSRRARQKKIRVLTSLGSHALGEEDLSGRAPLHHLAPVLEDLADLAREMDLELGPEAALLSWYAPSLEAVVPAPAGPSARPAAQAHREVFTGLDVAFLALSRKGPVLIVLDDVQWADDLTLAYLEHVATDSPFGEARVRIVGLSRIEEMPPRLAALQGLASVRLIAVDRLSEKSVAKMLHGMLAIHPVPRRLITFLARQSEGNPFYVTEYVRAAVSEGILRRDAPGNWRLADDRLLESALPALPLPQTLRRLVGRRLENLSEPARQVVEQAAVLGRACPESLLTDLLTIGEQASWEGIQELLSRQILEAPRVGECRFVHDKIREVVYEGLPAEQRAGLHGRAATHLQESARPEDSARIGHHWEQAGQADAARRHYLDAAHFSADRHDHQDAERLFAAYFRLTQEADGEQAAGRAGECAGARAGECAGARNAFAFKVLELSGRTEEAMAERRRARDEAVAAGDTLQRIDAIRGIATGHRIRGELDQARGCLDEALAVPGADSHPRILATIRRDLGGILCDQGRLEEGHALFDQALAGYRSLGDRPGEGVVLSDLALVHQFEGRMERARVLYEEALTIHRDLGAARHEASTLLNLATLEHVLSRLSLARDLYQNARLLCQRLCDRRNEASAIANLADIEAECHGPSKAVPLYQEAVTMQREVGETRNRSIALTNLSRAEAELGSWPRASAGIAEAIELLERLGDRAASGRCPGRPVGDRLRRGTPGRRRGRTVSGALPSGHDRGLPRRRGDATRSRPSRSTSRRRSLAGRRHRDAVPGRPRPNRRPADRRQVPLRAGAPRSHERRHRRRGAGRSLHHPARASARGPEPTRTPDRTPHPIDGGVRAGAATTWRGTLV